MVPSFACCQGFCETQVLEVVANDGAAGYESQQVLPAIPAIRQPSEEAESPKVRLRRVIRDFAHVVVGQGLAVEVVSAMISETANMAVPGVLRMDKRLSRLEIKTKVANTTVSLADVKSFEKGRSLLRTKKAVVVSSTEASPEKREGPKKQVVTSSDVDSKEQEPHLREQLQERDKVALTVVQHDNTHLELFFDSGATREQACSCLKIFHMSVQASMETEGLDSPRATTSSTISAESFQ